MIMQNKPVLQTPATSLPITELKQEPVNPNRSLVLNEVDNFYVNQIKNALSNMVKPNLNMTPSAK